MRRVVTGRARNRAGRTRSSARAWRAAPTVYVVEREDAELLASIAFAGSPRSRPAIHVSTHQPPADAFRLADVADIAVAFHHAQGNKCARAAG